MCECAEVGPRPVGVGQHVVRAGKRFQPALKGARNTSGSGVLRRVCRAIDWMMVRELMLPRLSSRLRSISCRSDFLRALISRNVAEMPIGTFCGDKIGAARIATGTRWKSLCSRTEFEGSNLLATAYMLQDAE